MPARPFLLSIVLLSLWLVSCASRGPSPSVTQTEATRSDPAVELLAQGQFLAAAQLFEQRGLEATDDDARFAHWDQAADALARAGAVDELLRLIGQLDPLATSLTQRWQLRLLQAHWHLLRQEPLLALGRVQGQRAPLSGPHLRWRGAEVMALALAQLQDGVAAVQALVDGGGGLEPADEARRIALMRDFLLSHELYWLMPASRLDSRTRGWLELGEIARRLWATEEALLTAFDRWAAQNPQHPGLALREDLRGLALRTFQDAPRHLALLLPLSGPLAPAATAIRDGFLSAYYRAGEQRLQLSVFDTESMSPTNAFDAAVAGGADLIIGPLRKSAVAQTLRHNSFALPQIALNLLPPNQPRGAHVLPLGLPPEDDAIAAAEQAVSQGHLRVVALGLNDAWAQRSVEAFATALAERGGLLVDQVVFDANAESYPQAIQTALQLERSRDRAQRIAHALDQHLEYELQRRQDADALYLAAHAADARQIRPQIRFYHGADLPVYASGRLFDGDLSRSERDLNGVRFCSIPWLLGSTESWQSARAELSQWRDTADRDWARFHALGIDAYALATQARSGGWAEGLRLSGASGELLINQGRLQRRLPCAEYREGRPELVSAP